MIVISFDDAVNTNNYQVLDRLVPFHIEITINNLNTWSYDNLLKTCRFLNSNLKNPNGCDIKSTFFVSHRYNNYSMVQVTYISLLESKT